MNSVFEASFFIVVISIFDHGVCASSRYELLQIDPDHANDTTIPSRIIVNYVSKYFEKSDKFVKIRMSSGSIKQHRLHMQLIDAIARDEKLSNFTFELTTNVEAANQHSAVHPNLTHIRRNPFYLFIIDSIKAFPAVVNLAAVKSRDYKARKKSLTVLTVKHRDSEHLLRKVYHLAWQYGVMDFNVLLPHSTEQTWSLETYQPFRGNCFAVESRRIASFTRFNYMHDMNITFDQLYAPKNWNFHKCPITVVTYPVPPYVLVQEKMHDGRNVTVFDGIEVMVINNIAKAINLTLVYKNIGRKGDAYENGTVTGTVKEIVENRANLSIGLIIRKTTRDAKMIPTISFLQVGAHFAYTIHAEFESPLSRLLAPFSTPLWIFLAVFVAISVIIVLLTKHLPSKKRHFLIGGRLNRTPVFNMFHLMFDGSVANRLMLRQTRYFGTFSRSLTMIWILGFLVIRNAYQSSLYTYLQEQRLPSPYDTVQKVNRSGVIINVSPEASEIFSKLVDPKRIRVSNLVHQDIAKKVANRELNGVVPIATLVLNILNKEQPVDRRLETSKDILLNLNHNFYFSKSSSTLVDPFDKHIQLYTEAGLINAWVQKYAAKIKVRNKLDKRQPKRLHVKNVLGAVMIFAGLSGLSIIVFLMEVLKAKVVLFERIIDYLTY